MDLQMSVMNLPTNLKLPAQHVLNKDLEVTRYHINLTATVTSATSSKGGLQITKANPKLTLLELGGKFKWEYYDLDTGRAVPKSYFRFYLTVLLSFRHLLFDLLCLFSMSHLFLCTALLQGERST